jgi:hypothetical protein
VDSFSAHGPLQAELVDYYKKHPEQDPDIVMRESLPEATDDGEAIVKRSRRDLDPLDVLGVG